MFFDILNGKSCKMIVGGRLYHGYQHGHEPNVHSVCGKDPEYEELVERIRVIQ